MHPLLYLVPVLYLASLSFQLHNFLHAKRPYEYPLPITHYHTHAHTQIRTRISCHTSKHTRTPIYPPSER